MQDMDMFKKAYASIKQSCWQLRVSAPLGFGETVNDPRYSFYMFLSAGHGWAHFKNHGSLMFMADQAPVSSWFMLVLYQLFWHKHAKDVQKPHKHRAMVFSTGGHMNSQPLLRPKQAIVSRRA